MKHTVIVCYDISDDKVRRKVEKTLQAHGNRIQYSVFEIVIGTNRLGVLRRQLQSAINFKQDIINYYPMCQWCHAKIILQGNADMPSKEGFKCIC